MAHESDDDWEIVARRMERVPESIASFESASRAGIAKGLVAARRQALGCAQQAATWGGQRESVPFFRALAAQRPDDTKLAEAAEIATSGYARLAAYLSDEYAPAAAQTHLRADGRDERRIGAADLQQPIAQLHASHRDRERMFFSGAPEKSHVRISYQFSVLSFQCRHN